MKIKSLIVVATLLSSTIYAEQLEVTADKFTHIEKENKAIFEGHAHAINDKSRVDADRFVIYLDKNNKTKEYHAVGHVRFEIIKPDQHVKGSCDRLIYNVIKETYRLKGHAKIKDILNGREMSGDEVYLDNLKKEAKAKSHHKKPVKFIFQMKDIKESTKGKK